MLNRSKRTLESLRSKLGLRIVLTRLMVAAAVASLSLWSARQLCADEFIIDSRNNEVYRLGEVDCTSCRSFPKSLLSFPESESLVGLNEFSFEMTTGELWRYYKQQGIDSTDRIVLYVGVDHIGMNQDLVLDSFKFSIAEDRKLRDVKLTQVMFSESGKDRLIIPGYETYDSKPEARMEIDLGYDFMARFNPGSQEKITLNARMAGAPDVIPNFYIAGRQKPWSPPDFKLVLGFALFWVVVFWLLKLITFRHHSFPTTQHRQVPA